MAGVSGGLMPLDRYPKKPCKYCGKLGHYPYQCFKNPKKNIKQNGLKQNGKYAKQWTKTRDTWIRQNPPPIDGRYWECYLRIHEWCPVRLDIKTLTVDHVVARTRDPSLRFDQSNLRPACWYCNDKKGSKSLEQVRDSML